MSKWIRHQSLLTLLGLGVVIFLAFWILSYYLLPEGVLRGRTASAALSGEEAAGSLLPEFLRIVLLNTFMMALVVAANRLLIIKGFPLGYFPPLVLSAMYAVTLGTNSFSMPLPARMAPSLEVLLRSGGKACWQLLCNHYSMKLKPIARLTHISSSYFQLSPAVPPR